MFTKYYDNLNLNLIKQLLAQIYITLFKSLTFIYIGI